MRRVKKTSGKNFFQPLPLLPPPAGIAEALLDCPGSPPPPPPPARLLLNARTLLLRVYPKRLGEETDPLWEPISIDEEERDDVEEEKDMIDDDAPPPPPPAVVVLVVVVVVEIDRFPPPAPPPNAFF